MFFQRLIAFILLALMPLLAFAETTPTSTLTTHSTFTTTEVTYVTRTGSPPPGSTGNGSNISGNSTITISPEPSADPSASPYPGAAAGRFKVSSGLAGAAMVAAVIGLL